MKFRVMLDGLGLPPQEVTTIEACSREAAQEALDLVNAHEDRAAQSAGLGLLIEGLEYTLEPIG